MSASGGGQDAFGADSGAPSSAETPQTASNNNNNQNFNSIFNNNVQLQSGNINSNNINSSSSASSINNNFNNINTISNSNGAAITIGADQTLDKTTPLDDKPRILIMGLRRSGKSSIQKVVFHKLSPNETLLLESTNKIVKDDISDSSFVSFVIWDFPGQIDFCDPTFDSKHIFGKCGALVFVIDAQDDYTDAMNKLHMTVVHAHKINPNITFEVFIHKVDGLSDDNKIEAQSNINIRANEDLMYAGYEDVRLSFYLTSIYDHTIFEAFSKVVQKLIRQLPTLANLLNFFISNSGIEKAFLFDVVTKIYIATDYAPVDMQSYELCCDMIDVIIDISCIYGVDDANDGSAFDEQSFSVIKLNNGTALYLREVNRFLALVCILREENLTEKQGVIDYNFQCFRRAINEVFELKNMRSMQSYESNCNLTTSSG